MYELKTVSVRSLARVMSFIAALVYIMFAVISLVSGTTAFGSGMVSLVIGIILFGVLGALLGALLAWGYNVAARRWGGLHLDFRLLEDADEHDERSPDAADEHTHQPT